MVSSALMVAALSVPRRASNPRSNTSRSPLRSSQVSEPTRLVCPPIPRQLTACVASWARPSRRALKPPRRGRARGSCQDRIEGDLRCAYVAGAPKHSRYVPTTHLHPRISRRLQPPRVFRSRFQRPFPPRPQPARALAPERDRQPHRQARRVRRRGGGRVRQHHGRLPGEPLEYGPSNLLMRLDRRPMRAQPRREPCPSGPRSLEGRHSMQFPQELVRLYHQPSGPDPDDPGHDTPPDPHVQRS